ncbi:MAG: hypothetical protein ACOCUI_00985 [bacterium]
MTDIEIYNEIFDILENKIYKKYNGRRKVDRLQVRLKELIELYPEGPKKERMLNKIKDKQRFTYYINDTGILDFTGYGKQFW